MNLVLCHELDHTSKSVENLFLTIEIVYTKNVIRKKKSFSNPLKGKKKIE